MRNILLLAAFFGLALVGRHANADSVYTLNYDSCTSGCGNGQGTSNNNFGYVDLSQVGSNQVQVTLKITNPSYIVNTGNGTNHAPFAFNTDKSITISSISDGVSNPSIYFTAGAINAGVSGLGTFNYEINCTTNCTPGASNGGEGTYLSFLVSAQSGALSLNDFIANAGGFYFASDILGPTGLTGEVAANQSPTTTTNTSGGSGGSGGNSNVTAVRRMNARSTLTMSGSASRSGANRSWLVCSMSNSQPMCACHSPLARLFVSLP